MSEDSIEIDVATVKTMLDAEDDFLLLDCREHAEHEIARVEKAKLYPMSDIVNRIDELKEFADKRVVVMCHLGGRSLRVTQWLRNNGFDKAQNMTGGIDAWSVEIDADVPRY